MSVDNYQIVLEELDYEWVRGPNSFQMSRKEAGIQLKRLVSEGFAQYSPAFDEDSGLLCGSGYVLTREGGLELERLQRQCS